MSTGLRLGVYADLRYGPGPDGDGVVCDSAFVRFIAALGAHVDRLVVFGRLAEPGERVAPVAVLRADEAEFVALPDYRSLVDVTAVARALGPSRATWGAHLSELDAILIFGPHPMALALASDARSRDLPVILGVRQYLPDYLIPRSSPLARPMVAGIAHALERAWQRLARRCPTVVTGPDLARHYRRAPQLLDVPFSLVDDAHIVGRSVSRGWPETATALSVGRLDPEKNPLLLADIAAGLAGAAGRQGAPGWRLRAVGGGSMAGQLSDRRHDLGADDHLDLPGPVPHGDALWADYAAADALLHVSFTEGQPQVLLEAMAAGLPIVATAVGGVPAMLGEGERGLLIPSGDCTAAVAALERLRADPALRDRLVEAATRYVREHTMNAESGRVAAFVAEAVTREPVGAAR